MKRAVTILTCLTIFMSTACTKKADLDKIPDSTLLPLTTLEDAQAILDNMDVMRQTPALSEISSDNLYILYSTQFSTTEWNAYVWQKDLYDVKGTNDWASPYKQVYYANSILTTLPTLNNNDQKKADFLKGSALFIRGYAFYNVALEFANLYDSSTAQTLPGIPLRYSPDPLLEKSVRGTVEQTYQQIIKDITEAAPLLPRVPDPRRKNRPSMPAAFALLARVYLSMNQFAKAKLYADSSLMLYSTLLDYKSLDSNSTQPFTLTNEEVLYLSNLDSNARMVMPGFCYIDSNLYQSYDDADLRKTLFFSIGNIGLPVGRYSYSSDYTRFSGLAVDEVYLIRAECKARLQDLSGAMQDMVTLRTSRWKTGFYTPPALTTSDEVLQFVLSERRKELVFRGLRWMDIRRLNKLGANISLQRNFNGQIYALPPGDARFVLPIPPDVIQMSGMEQNPR